MRRCAAEDSINRLSYAGKTRLLECSPKIIVCETKYNSDTRLGREVIYDVQAKVDAFLARHPRYARYTVEMALVTMEPIPEELKNEGYFSYLITPGDLIATAALDARP